MHWRLTFITWRLSRVSCRNVYCSYRVRAISSHDLICGMKTKGHCSPNFPFQNPSLWNVDCVQWSMTMDWHSSVRTRYKILDNEAQSEDERIATWYMIPWINIQRHLHSERDLFIGFGLKEIFPVVFSHHTFYAFILTPHIVRLYAPYAQ